MSSGKLISRVVVAVVLVVIVVTSTVAFRTIRSGRLMLFFNENSHLALRARQEGETLAEHIERFRGERGRLPQGLDELVPEYVPRIVPPSYGEPRWIYYPDADSGEFTLGFGADDGYPAAHLRSRERTWHADR